MIDITPEEYADIIGSDRLAFTEEVFNQIGSGEYVDNWHVHAIVEHLQALDDGELGTNNLIINMPPRLMKLLADDTLVPTPTGYKLHGDLKEGDELYHPSGEIQTVVGVAPKDVADHEVEISNGEVVTCNLDHLWTVYDRWAQKWKTLETRDMLDTGVYKGDRCRYQLPDVSPLDNTEKELTIHPYYLGYWLGDGQSDGHAITHHVSDSSGIDKIENVCGYKHSNRWLLNGGTTYKTSFAKNKLRETLREHDLYKNKHIPDLYLNSSIQQRSELLAGLIDSDGTVCKSSGRVTISTISEVLRDGVVSLCESLGFRPYVTDLITSDYDGYGGGNPYFQIGFNPCIDLPTVIPRKKIWKTDFVRRRHGIKSIKKVDGVQGNCIKVSSPDGLYVVGRKHVATHNTISISIADSAWRHGMNPAEQIICASHSLKIGKEINGKCLDVMQSDIYRMAFPDTRLTKQTEEWFKTDQQGHRLVATVGNKVTGFGADRLYIDDPIDPEAALSEAERERANRWIPSTLFSRANDQNEVKKILVMQRLHEEDPSGLFIEKGGWYHLSLPAKFHRKTFIEIREKKWEMEEGEYLFPARLGKTVLDDLQRDMGPYSFSGQYMQNPAPIGGGEFKQRWIRHYNNLSKNFSAKGMNVYIMCDPASGKKNKSTANKGYKEIDQDYTAMIVVGLHHDKNYYVLDMIRDRLNPTERIDVLMKLHMKWNRLSGKPPKVVYEDYGLQSDLHYINKAKDQLNYHFSVVKVGGRVMKEDRIRRLIPLFENERVYLPRRINYTTVRGETIELVKELIDHEMMTFPVAKHDDMLDAFARLLEEEVYATFPGSNLKIHRVGETYRDEILGDFDEDNFNTW